VILQELSLFNFCLYAGEQVIDLAPERRNGKNRPVVLFGGINGGGKTTILDAVQLALYGSRARCSKRNNQSYEQFLRDCINRNVDPGDGASVGLSFRYTSEGQEHLYEVTRRWHGAAESVREKLEVFRDGERDKWLSDNWSSVVEELIPIGVSRLFFFDAEQIRFLAEDSTSNETLGNAIKALLGLDLAERLITDSKVLESRLIKDSPLSDNDSEKIAALETQVRERDEQIADLTGELATIEGEKQRLDEEVRRAERAFAKAGGKHWEKREKQIETSRDLELQNTETKTRMLHLVGGDLPLALAGEFLEKVSVQDKAEADSTKSKVIQEILEERDKQILDSLSSELSKANLQTVEEILADDRQARVFAEKSGVRHALSERARAGLERLLSGALEESHASAAELVCAFSQNLHDLEAVKRSLAATPKEDAIKDVAKTLREKSIEAGALGNRVNRVQKDLERARNEREEADKRRSKLSQELLKGGQFKAEESGRLAELAGKTQKIMERFLVLAASAKIDRLSGFVTESFRFLLRKKTLVERVQIDPKTFAITLFDAEGNAISKQRLSEGEKQIFAISVLWGLARASARPLPAIIDTPMARLDATHRDHLVERYFPNASHQVIILSTDTEVDEEYYKSLQPQIARSYHLDYSEKKKLTEATEGYFWEPEPAASGVA